MGDPVTWAIISAGISLGTTIYTALNMETPERVGSKVQKRGTRAPRKIPYGKSIIDSVNVYNNVYNRDSDWMVNIFSLGVGEITNIHQVYIDDLPLLRFENSFNPSSNPSFYFDRDNNDFVDAYDTQDIRMQFRYGRETETASNLAQLYSDGEWTTSHRGDRVPHVVINLNRSTDTDTPVFSSTYTLTALVSGLPIHDPRYHAEGQKTFDHSWYVGTFPNPENFQCGRNPALCLLDFLTDTYYGMSIPYEYIDEQSFIDAANWCDANEIYIDGSVDTGESYSSCLQEILSSFFGILTITKGLVKCQFEDIVALPYETTFDESNTIHISDIVGSNNETYYNVVETEYKNQDMGEKGDVFQIPSDIYFIPAGETKSRIEKDGFVKTQTLEMPMTIDNYNGTGVSGAVKLFTNRAYIKSLYQRGVTIKIDLSQHELGVFDVIKISNESLGWVEELFRIVNIKKSVDDDDFNIGELVCTEYNDEIYSGTDAGLYGRSRTRTYKQLKPVTNLTFSLENFVTDGYGSLTWDDPNTTKTVDYLVEYKLSSSANWQYLTNVTSPIAKTPNLKKDDYDFRVSVRKFGWLSSIYTELLNETIGSIVQLPTPTNVNVVSDGKDFNITWDDMLDTDVLNTTTPTDPDSGGTSNKVKDFFKTYKISIYHSAVLVGEYQSSTPEYDYTFIQNLGNGLSRDVTVEVQIVALDESISLSGTDSTSNTQMGLPSGVNIDSKIGSIDVYWDTRTEQDFSGTEIHISDTPLFTPSALTLVGLTQQSSSFNITFPVDQLDRYVKIGHYDVFGRDSMVYSGDNLATYEPPFDDTQLQSDLLTLDDQLNNPTTGLQKQLEDLNLELDASFPITETQISDDAISTPKLKANAVTAAKILAGTITTNEIAADTITANNIAVDTITANEIAAGAITALEIATNAVTANKILAGAITADKLEANIIIGTDATFSGTLSAATGTFSGTITGGSLNINNKFIVDTFGNLTSTGISSIDRLFCDGTGGRALDASTASASDPVIRAINTGTGNGLSVNALGGTGAIIIGSTTGVRGEGGTYDFYAGGAGTNYAPFTGSHEGLVPNNQTFNVGDIVCDKELINIQNISNAICEMELSTSPNQNSARGVFVHINDLIVSRVSGLADTQTNLEQDYKIIGFNALGEGAINVCGEGGDIQVGDLITTSSMHGKGMKQTDQTNIKPFTVAQARQNVAFSSPTEVKQIACIYKCG